MKLTVKNLVCTKDKSHTGVKTIFCCHVCNKPVVVDSRGFYECGEDGEGMFSHTIIKSNDYKRMMVCAECGSLVEEQTTAELASGNPKSVSYQTWLKTRKGELHEL